jgi:hypothetical protein
VFALTRPSPSPSQGEGSKGDFQSDLVQSFLDVKLARQQLFVDILGVRLSYIDRVANRFVQSTGPQKISRITLNFPLWEKP